MQVGKETCRRVFPLSKPGNNILLFYLSQSILGEGTKKRIVKGFFNGRNDLRKHITLKKIITLS